MTKLVTSLLAGLFLILGNNQLLSTNAIASTTDHISYLAPPLRFNVSGGTVNVGEKICLDFTVQDFQQMVGFSFTIKWNQSVLRFDSLNRSTINLPGLETNSFNSPAAGELLGSWFLTTPTPVSRNNGDRIFQLCFTALAPGSAGMNFPATSTQEGIHNVDGEIPLIGTVSPISVIGDPVDNCGKTNKLGFFVTHEKAAPGSSVCVKVKAEDFINILTFQWSMTYDPAILRYDTAYGLALPGFDGGNVGNTNPGELTVFWLDLDFEGLTLADCEPLYEICFDVIGQMGDISPVTFADSPTSKEVADSLENSLNADYYDGSVTLQNTRPNFKITADEKAVMKDEQVCLDVKVDGFTSLKKLQYTTKWDPAKLEYVGIQNLNLAGLDMSDFTVNAGTGTVETKWDAAAGNPVTLTNGSVIYQLCLKAIGNPGSSTDVNFIDAPTKRIAINGANDTLNFQVDNGKVSVQKDNSCGSESGFAFFASNETAQPGEQVCFEIAAQNFTAIGSFQWTFEYNPAILRFDTAYKVNLQGFDFGNIGVPPTSPGKLTVSWVDPTPDFRGITVADCLPLFNICFEVLGTVGQTDSLLFTESLVVFEVSDKDGRTLNPTFRNGGFRVTDNPPPPPTVKPVIFTAQNKTVDEGEQVCVGVSAQDFKELTHAQFSMDWDQTKLQYVAVQNLNLGGLMQSDFTANTTNGTLTVNWDAPTPQGVTVANATIIYEVCFMAIGTAPTTTDVLFTNTPLDTFVTNATNDTVPFKSTKGVVTINKKINTDCGTLPGLSFYLPQATGKPGDIVCLDLKARAFTAIGALQWVYNYDPTVLRFDTTYTVNLPGYTDGNINVVQPGTIFFSWVDPDPQFRGVTIPDCETLLKLCFEIIGPNGSQTNVTMDGSPGDVEIGDKDGNILTGQFANGRVNVDDDDPPPCSFSAIGTVTNVVCKGSSTGKIELTLTGPTTGYTFLWSYQGRVTQNLENIPAGTHTVTITNCSKSTPYSFTVLEPATLLKVEVNEVINNLCQGDAAGEISVQASGGWGKYTFSWRNGLPPQSHVTGLLKGDYYVSVTDSLGCVASLGPIKITEPRDGISITGNVINETCFNRRDGAINITASGGTVLPGGGLKYFWTGNVQNPNQEDQSNLAPGTYTVRVTDDGNCSKEESFTVTGSTEIDIQLRNLTNAPAGSIDIEVMGGSPNYTFRWTGPSGSLGTNQDLSGLCPGVYSVTVTDSRNCEKNATFTIGGSCVTVTGVTVTKTCPGENTGTVEVFTSGGGNPTIAWTPSILGTAFRVTGLAAGNYSYVVTAGGTQIGSGTVTVDPFAVIQIDSIQVVGAIGATQTGRINVLVTGGTGSYDFRWTPTNAATEDLTNVFAGRYTLLVTDKVSGCQQRRTFDVPFVAPATIVRASLENTKCPNSADGSATVNFPTGVAPFSVRLIPGGAYVPANNGNSHKVENLAAGTYQIEVRDANNTRDTVSVTISSPPTFNATVQMTPKTAQNGGSINLSVTGGTLPYRFTWNNGATSEDLFSLNEGCYRVTVTDENDCVFITPEYCVSFFRVVDYSLSNVNCANDITGRISVTVDGGNEPYRYEWRNNSVVVGRDSVLTGVGAGVYFVRIIGSQGTIIEEGPYEIKARSAIEAEAIPRSNFGGYNVPCFNSSVGVAEVNAVKGVQPYSYLWSNNMRDKQVQGLEAGLYTVTVTDAIGCKAASQIEITAPPAIILSADVKRISCPGAADGEIRLYVTGGIATGGRYQYTWSQTTLSGATVRSLREGTYSVSVSDNFGCEVVKQFNIEGPDQPLTVTVETTDDEGSGTGSALARISGGTEPYQIRWNNYDGVDSASVFISKLSAGTYAVIVRDSFGCMAISSGIVKDLRVECLTSRTVITPEGDGLNDAFLISCLENYPRNTLEIYNRWGQLVFKQENYDNTWEGTTQRGDDLPEGGYFYIFEYYDQDNKVQQMKGSFTLIRE